MIKRLTFFFICITCFVGSSWAQTTSDSSKAFLQFTVKEDVLTLQPKKPKKAQVYSASKTLEDYLVSPVSATVISQQMIARSGALNIPEALRLAPGVWVTQKTNGNYEVYLRRNTVHAGSLNQDAKNAQLMVVIDHVPQYDYLLAGIIWEALPVTIQDIERIEVITTPSGVFYGNAAITGVIHIFTKKVASQNLNFSLESQAGATGFNLQNGGAQDISYLHQASVSGGISDKFRFRLSGHYHFLKRFQEDYFLLSENRWLPSDSLLFKKYNVPETNLNTRKGQERFGANAFAYYAFNNKVFLQSRISYQNTFAQTIQTDDTLALAQRTTNTLSANVNAFIHKLHLTASYTIGERDYAQGYAGNQFLLNQLQAMADYRFRLKKVDIQPGVGFLQSNYNPRQQQVSNEDFTNYYAFLKTSIEPMSKLRIMASLRGDFFTQANMPFISYQLSSTYQMGYHLIRGSFTYNEAPALLRRFRQNAQHTILPELGANSINALELGWSANIQSRINTSLSIFFNQGNYQHSIFDSTGSSNDPLPTSNSFNFAQAGVSAEVSLRWSKFDVRGFITLQKSGPTLSDFSNNGFGNTPQFYGGLQLNYEGFLEKLNVNAQLYFYKSHTIVTQYQTLTIPTKALLNFKLSYKIWKENSVFLNIRNALNNASQEFVFADQIPAFFLLGLQANF